MWETQAITGTQMNQTVPILQKPTVWYRAPCHPVWQPPEAGGPLKCGSSESKWSGSIKRSYKSFALKAQSTRESEQGDCEFKA